MSADDQRRATATLILLPLSPEQEQLLEAIRRVFQQHALEDLAAAPPPAPAPPPALEIVSRRRRSRQTAREFPKPKAIRVPYGRTFGDQLQFMAQVDPARLKRMERRTDRWFQRVVGG